MHPGSTGCPPTCPWSWLDTLCGCHVHASTTLHPPPRLGRGFATGLCDYVNLCFVPGDPQCCRTDPFSPNQSFPPHPIPFFVTEKQRNQKRFSFCLLLGFGDSTQLFAYTQFSTSRGFNLRPCPVESQNVWGCSDLLFARLLRFLEPGRGNSLYPPTCSNTTRPVTALSKNHGMRSCTLCHLTAAFRAYLRLVPPRRRKLFFASARATLCLKPHGHPW
jgi:hypothetical protein